MAAGVAGVLIIGLLVIALLAIVVGVITVIAKWKMLSKAGEAGWKALIPVYGDMVMCKISGVWEYYPLVVLGTSVFVSLLGDSSISTTLSLLFYVVSIYYTVILSISVAQSFGKDSGFGVGLILVGFIFYPILGFGSSQYVGAKPMKDPVMDSILKKNGEENTNNVSAPAPEVAETKPEEPTAVESDAQDTEENKETVENAPQGNYCPSCGNPNEADSAFCVKCGNKLK